ncbi:ABC-F family ATP-binding cassette domain-containing protein [bacterium]|nr:ABC-F family ATP-binding cassette domain-containing protein [bacterium]
MSLLTINNLHKSYAAQEVLRSVSTEINRGDHIGLVGRNGVGKTTLLRLLEGSEEATDGHIVTTTGVRIAYLKQDPLYHPGRTLYEEVREGIAALDSIEEELRQIEVELADPSLEEDQDNYKRLMDRYAYLHDIFDTRDGWKADAKVEGVLDGLGIKRFDWERDISTFSGGERNIIGLARILVQDPDIMLLDEPGNHLDFEGLDWLENVLKASRNAFILVSHNRYLLDNTCRKMWELDYGKIEEYSGNYSAYRAEKLLRIEKAESAVKRMEKERARLQFQIHRLKSWADVYDNPRLARTAKQFERRIEKMEVDAGERIREDKRKMGIRFGGVRTKGDIALDVNEYSRDYGDDKLLIENATFRIAQGDKVALVGANGTGKTTLFNDIISEGRWENMTLRVGKSMKIGYFTQMGQNLEFGNSLVEEAMRLGGLLRNEAEGLLYRFLFSRDDLDKPVSVLSGGEKARLQLATLMIRHPNFLLLDEPTNHLDIRSREVVEDALEEFEGTIFVISHDRYFLDKMVELVLYINPPQIVQYEGNFSDFFEAYTEEKKRSKEKIVEENVDTKKSNRVRSFRKLKFNKERFDFLEKEIERLEEQRERLSSEIEKEESKGNTKRANIKRDTLQQTEANLEIIYEEWFAMGDKKATY